VLADVHSLSRFLASVGPAAHRLRALNWRYFMMRSEGL
jgi:hypothetical protein